MFVYALAPEPTFGPPSFQLLQRVSRAEIKGFASAHVLADVAHRLMSLEACAKFNWPFAGIANRLKRHPSQIKRLLSFRQALDQILALDIHLLPVNAQTVLLAGDLSIQHGLLTGDALIIAIMQSNGISALASNDADLDTVASIARFAPA